MDLTFDGSSQWLLPQAFIPKLIQNTVEQYTIRFTMDESWAPYTAVSAAFSKQVCGLDFIGTLKANTKITAYGMGG